jgi:uncharacterized protein
MDIKDWLSDNTVYITLAGSRAYGLETPESDWDYRGAAIPPAQYHMGLLNFEQADSKGTINLVSGLMGKYPVTDAEITIWSLKKMISLAADGNPNMIELLFMDESDFVMCNQKIMRPFFDIRDSFVSKLLKHRFSGYAMQQLKRIRNHKRWMDNPPSEPTREQFGIEGVTMAKDQLFACDKLIELQVDQWLVTQDHLPEDIKIQLGPEMIRMINVILEQIQIETQIDRLKDVLERAANRHLGFDADFINFLTKFKAYRAAKAEYQSYLTWKKQRNPIRAELERKFGYDTKHGMHLVRLLRMAREILETGQVIVRRIQDAEELRAIRYHGIWPYERLVSWAEEEDKALDIVMNGSKLSRSPNRKLIGNILTEVTFNYLSLDPKILDITEPVFTLPPVDPEQLARGQKALRESITEQIEPLPKRVTPHLQEPFIPVEDDFRKLQESLYLDGWKRTSEPDFNFYQDVMDGGDGPDQDVVFTKEGKSVIITTDHTLRAVKAIKKGVMIS